MKFSYLKIERVILIICFMIVASNSALAFAALAIGQSNSITKDGIALGHVFDKATKEQAEAEALSACKDFQRVKPAIRNLCKIIKTFEKQCLATALDPKAGTPGFGWAVMTEKASAESAAMEDCRSTAGKSRVKFCKVDISFCDSSN